MPEDLHHNVALVRIYLVFRAALAAVLLIMFISGLGIDVLGTEFPKIYFWVSIVYFSLCAGTVASITFAQYPYSFTKIASSLVIDVLAVVVLIHTSGGLDSGLGYLLVIFVAMGSIFLRGQIGIAFAALVCILVIAQSIYIANFSSGGIRTVFSAGTLGIILFGTAFIFQFLTEKLRASSEEAAAQAEFAEQLQQLAQAIVARMRTGIIVVDEQLKIILINESALQLLGLPQNHQVQNSHLESIPNLPDVFIQLSSKSSGAGPANVIDLPEGQSIRVSMAVIDLGQNPRRVFFLEDHRVMTQQAQQLKLASLGRLTASIAHEIRNPLGAISHAAQLLAESENIADSDLRLTEIIHQHSNRVNQIIESTLALSRRKEPKPEVIDLSLWLPNYVNQYKLANQPVIDLVFYATRPMAKIDPTHFSQVLTNLLDNGLRYGYKKTGENKIRLEVNKLPADDTAYLDIIDYGEGIGSDQLAHIFDPFYTTDEKGSGLGLYISKELCEINQATLTYRRTDAGLSCFRISFSHHQRMF